MPTFHSPSPTQGALSGTGDRGNTRPTLLPHSEAPTSGDLDEGLRKAPQSPERLVEAAAHLRKGGSEGSAGPSEFRHDPHSGARERALVLVTPPLSDGVLPGIVRAQVLALAPACGLTVEERPLTLDDLRAARAVFVTNSLRLLAPVSAIGETAYESDGHPAFARLRGALCAAVAESCGVAPEEVA